MKRSEAAKYARWSAAAALLLAGLTAGLYAERRWTAHREKQKAPPPAPINVTRLLNGISFSKMNGDRKIFIVDASKSTDFKDRNVSLLEDVKITIFGMSGARHDVIRSKSCQYEQGGGGILCSGEVQFDLQSAADADREAQHPGSSIKQKVHAETREVKFDRSTGLASTSQRIKFVFPNGSGDGVGVEYYSEAGKMRLLKDVHLLLLPGQTAAATAVTPGASAREPVRVTGTSLDFARDSRILLLHGPVKAENSQAQLLAGELTLDLDAAFRAEKLVATAGATGKNPELISQEKDGPLILGAEILTAHIAPEGWITTIEGAGTTQGSRSNGTETEEFSSDNASLELLPKVNDPKLARLTGNVTVKTRAAISGQQRILQTSELLLEFAQRIKGEPARLKHAETLSAGSIQWIDPGGTPVAPATRPATSATASAASSAPSHTTLQADKLEMAFDDQGKAKELTATGNVHTQKELTGSPTQTATAQSGLAHLLPTGGWSQIELQGNVNLQEADRNAQAEHAVFFQATQSALLTGKAVARDTTTETHAPRLTFSQATGDMHADGHVRSTDFSSRGGAAQFAPVPANITSDSMQGNSKSGRALYTGHARLWQGDSVMEADSIELFRETKVLHAVGNVRAVFPQVQNQSSAQNPATPPAPAKTTVWHVTSGTLTYFDSESRAHLEKNVVAQSVDQTMRGPLADLYFTRSGTPPTAPNTSTAASGAQQISRAVGTGGVIVEQGTRRATAERGDYSALDGKFVMTGGDPTIYDVSEGTTKGRQLTFFLADDTIIVDSENGSRTLTKHRVEK